MNRYGLNLAKQEMVMQRNLAEYDNRWPVLPLDSVLLQSV